MAVPVVGDRYEVRVFTYVAITQTIGVNIIHYRVSMTAGSPPDESGMGTVISGAIAPAYTLVMSTLAKYHGIAYRRITPTIGGTLFSATGAAFGQVAGDMLPPFAAGLISKRTAEGGRRNRGRFYAAFPSETSNTANGETTALYITNLTALGVVLAGGYTIGAAPDTFTLTPCVFHRGWAGLGILPSTDITACPPGLKWATIRKRGAYRGPDLAPPV